MAVAEAVAVAVTVASAVAEAEAVAMAVAVAVAVAPGVLANMATWDVSEGAAEMATGCPGFVSFS